MDVSVYVDIFGHVSLSAAYAFSKLCGHGESLGGGKKVAGKEKRGGWSSTLCFVT